MPENQTYGTLASVPSTKKKPSPFSVWVIACTLCPLAVFAAPGPMSGPLHVHPQNPRYFTDGAKNPDGSLKAVYLTGSHASGNLQDMGETNPPAAFDFEAYLDFLERHHHNFIRLWHWELPRWTATLDARPRYCAPYPWPRTGPGRALDGQPKFNLNEFHPEYFRHLRARVAAAHSRGIYTAIMLFEGWSLQFVADGWKDHPFNSANNTNAIDGDLNGDGQGLEIHTLANPKVTAVQEAYVRQVILIDTDHLAGANNFIAPATAADHQWIWKSFLRGHNPILMDSLGPADARRESARRAMGHTRTFAERMNLAAMTPRSDLSSTTYCLAEPGNEYLVYQPKKGEAFSVEVKTGTYCYEWFNPTEGALTDTGRLDVADGKQQFKAPFEGDAVLYLEAQ